MKVYIVLVDEDYVGDFSEEEHREIRYDTEVVAVYSNSLDAKKRIHDVAEEIANMHHVIEEKNEKDGWLIELRSQDDAMFTDCRWRIRCIEEEVI